MKKTHLLAALGIAIALPAAADDWPQFRGINGSGVSTEKAALPVEFSFETAAWTAEIGDGLGSAVIVGDRVFSTGLTGERTFSVFCHNAASGEQLWRRDLETGELPRITPPNGHCSSTPAADDDHVYVYFSTIGLIAFDAASGDEVWRRKIAMPAYLMDWGPGASPIVYDGRVIFCQDDDLNPFVSAFDVKTGEEIWRTNRPEMLAGYALPVICEVDGRADLVIAGSGKLKGYDPATGEERWTCNTLLRTIMTSPVVVDDTIYVAVQSYGDATRTLKYALMEWLDTNQDGLLERAEAPKEFHERFDLSDKNGDKQIDSEEIETAFQHPDNLVGGGNTIQAVRGGGSGDVTETHLVWNIDNKSPSNLTSPLVVSNRLHVVKSGGISSCFDATNGEEVWGRTRLRNFGDYYASPVAGDGKIYFAGRNGFVVVIEDSPELNILAKNDLGEEIFATPSISNGRIFFRTRQSLICISNSN